MITSQSGALMPSLPPLAEVMIYCSNFLPGYHHHMYYLYVIIILITSSENQSYFYIFSRLD